jgi:adenosyl cobinamide kinase/adenosyl cobinamide phosphate guanylyltransferase
MELYIGGYKQGKYNYVLTKRNIPQGQIWNEFHLWFRQELLEARDAEADAWAYISEHPDVVVISDEVGNGIVPMEPFEREYRERLGRMLMQIAEKADRVERVLCGIGQRIK